MDAYKSLRIIFLILLALSSDLFLSSCTSVASRTLPPNREAFTSALLHSDEEQILLNIVRMEYGDRPYFLGVDNITSYNTVTAGINAAYTLAGTHGYSSPSGTTSITNTYGLTPSASYVDNPTVIYTPLKGEKFTRQMLTPISMEDIYLVIQSGWSASRILRLTSQRLGDMDNASNASRPSSSHVPKFKEFVQFSFDVKNL